MEIINSESVMADEWLRFLKNSNAQTETIRKIDFTSEIPIIYDLDGRKLSIDFIRDKGNYQKKKGSIKTELLSKAMGAGRVGRRVLDLSAGLGIDAIFLSQLGYQVTAVEKNPIVFLALKTAWNQLFPAEQSGIEFHFGSAQDFLKKTTEQYDVIYFDPMFPEKKKSALPRQEMIIFRELVGCDTDSAAVIEAAIESKLAQRIVVKRPLKAEPLRPKPITAMTGKLIRFDIYGGRLDTGN